MGSLDLQELHHPDGTCVLRVDGEIDESTADAFEFRLVVDLAESSRLIIDLTSCTVLSDGLAVLAGLQGMRDRVEVMIVAREACLMRMLNAVGISASLRTYRTATAALTAEEKQTVAHMTACRCARRPAPLEWEWSGSRPELDLPLRQV
jgi:anti-anti-sigma factor